MKWRLLLDRAADGAVNMAVDEALLESAMAPGSPPALRLYHFRDPTLTFGYGQDLAQAVDEPECRRRGIDCVRRITGGRALLHQDELTYSVAAPPMWSAVKAAYRGVAGAIGSALERLGVPVDEPGSSGPVPAPAHLPCLAVPTGHEITVHGRKVVASAMRYRRRGFLIHGSILWSIDRPLWTVVTRLAEQDPLSAVGLRELGGLELRESDVVQALASAFEELFGSSPTPSELTPEESERASGLAVKYRSAAWTRARIPFG